MTLARILPCGHTAPLGERCPQCGITPAEKAESRKKRSKQSYIEIYSTPRWRALRLEILRRDRFRCHECGAKATHAAHLTPHNGTGADPRAWDPRNLRASCATCNSREGSRRHHEEASHASQIQTPSRPHRDGRRRQEETTWVI